MTTPTERMRSLQWGWELLEALQQDRSIPPELVDRASRLMQIYPTPQALTRLLEADPPRWSPEFGQGIDDAHRLFEEIQFGGHGSPQTRRHTMYTLRHFPTMRAEAWAAAAASPDGLRRWLAEDDA